MSLFDFLKPKNPWIESALACARTFRNIDFDCVKVAKSVAWLVASDVGSTGPFCDSFSTTNISPFFSGDWASSYANALGHICGEDEKAHDVAVRLGLIYRESIESIRGDKIEQKQILRFLKQSQYRVDALFCTSLSLFWQIANSRRGGESFLDSFVDHLALMSVLKDEFMPSYVASAQTIQRSFRP